jgi:hypothetical protein
MTAAQKPVGHWPKHLDRLIETTFDRSLAEQDLSRRHWQTMNTLRSGPADASGLSDALRPFWSDGDNGRDFNVDHGCDRRGFAGRTVEYSGAVARGLARASFFPMQDLLATCKDHST